MLTAVSVNQSLDSLVVCNRLSIAFYFILSSHPPAIDHCTHILESRFGITLQTHSLHIYLTTHRLMAHFASPHPHSVIDSLVTVSRESATSKWRGNASRNPFVIQTKAYTDDDPTNPDHHRHRGIRTSEQPLSDSTNIGP